MGERSESGASTMAKIQKACGGRPRKEDLAFREQHFLDTAEQEFLSAGFTRTSMDNIALAAGVSKATIYRHYRDKIDIFRAVATRAITRASCCISQYLIDDMEPRIVLRRVARVILETMLGDVGKPSFNLMQARIMASESPFHSDLVDHLRKAWDTSVRHELALYLERMNDEGRLRIEDSEWAARALLRLAVPHFDLLTSASIDIPEEDRESLATRAVDLFLFGSLPATAGNSSNPPE